MTFGIFMNQENKKKVLVVYFTQTGQSKDLLDNILSPINNSEPTIELDMLELKSVKPFPFPWSKKEFFDVFPETYLGVPIELEQPTIDISKKYDLIILGWQPWYLSVSIPINSFLKTDFAKKLFDGVPVIPVSACRNMWVMGFEKLRNQLHSLNAKVVGNIALVDPNPNLVSVLTVVGWMIHGKKKNYKSWLPPAGVPDQELIEAASFGKIIKEDLLADTLNETNQKLIDAGSVKIKPALMMLEMRGNKLFGFWATYIRGKGDKLNSASTRRSRLKGFSYYLPIGIFILSPLASIFTKILISFNKKGVKKRMNYYLGIDK
jgi:hypothetical protein